VPQSDDEESGGDHGDRWYWTRIAALSAVLVPLLVSVPALLDWYLRS
jgi:hypothetical protein